MAEARVVQAASTPATLRYTNNSGASMAVGEVISINAGSGKRIAAVVMGNAIANGSTGIVAIRGRFSVAKSTSQAFSQGDQVYFDASANKADDATTAATVSDFVLGTAVAAAASSASWVTVDINEGPSAYAMGSSSSSSSSSS